MNNSESGVNTILLVVIIAAVVGGLVWFFSGQGTATDEPTKVEISVPGITEEPGTP